MQQPAYFPFPSAKHLNEEEMKVVMPFSVTSRVHLEIAPEERPNFQKEKVKFWRIQEFLRVLLESDFRN